MARKFISQQKLETPLQWLIFMDTCTSTTTEADERPKRRLWFVFCMLVDVTEYCNSDKGHNYTAVRIDRFQSWNFRQHTHGTIRNSRWSSHIVAGKKHAHECRVGVLTVFVVIAQGVISQVNFLQSKWAFSFFLVQHHPPGKCSSIRVQIMEH